MTRKKSNGIINLSVKILLMRRWEKPLGTLGKKKGTALAESRPDQAAGAAPEHSGEESGRVQRVMLCKAAPFLAQFGWYHGMHNLAFVPF